MREYNAPESWTFLYKFNRADLPILKNVTQFKPIFVIESSTLVLEHHGKLIRIECHEKEKPVCSGQYTLEQLPGEILASFEAIQYSQTLLLI